MIIKRFLVVTKKANGDFIVTTWKTERAVRRKLDDDKRAGLKTEVHEVELEFGQ